MTSEMSTEPLWSTAILTHNSSSPITEVKCHAGIIAVKICQYAVALGHLGTPAEVTVAVVFLAWMRLGFIRGASRVHWREPAIVHAPPVPALPVRAGWCRATEAAVLA